MTNLLILTEAGEHIGYGHLTRCFALQDYFLSRDFETTIFLNNVGGNYSFNLVSKVVSVDWLKAIGEVKNISRTITNVLVDSYLANTQYYRFLESHFENVIALDDFNRISYPAKVILNPNAYGDTIDYRNQTGKVLAGKQFVILRESFRERKQNFVVSNNIKKILVTFGGHDYRELMPEVIKLFKDRDFYLVLIAGTSRYADQLAGLFPHNNIEFIGYAHDREIADKMCSVDMAITAGGQTLNELAYLGIPSIGVCIDHDQVQNVRIYAQEGFLLEEVYWNDDLLFEKIAAQTDRMKDPELRRKMSEVGISLIDGRGVENIFENLQNN